VDPAERIVELWLQNQGYFTMNGVGVPGGKEIDFLALNPNSNKRVHVEVQVAVNPVGNLRPWKDAEFSNMPLNQRVELYFQNKFEGRLHRKNRQLLDHSVKETATELFGTREYERWLILGKQNESPEEIRDEFRKHGVEVHYVDEVLSGTKLKGTPKGATARFLQVMARFLTDESRQSLLGEANPSDNREELSH
jgi:hypothetical protein